MLPVPAGVSVGSYEGLWITLLQVLIGLALGLCVQLVFSAISGAGELMSVQMGLGFATLLDPTQTESAMLLGRFISLTAITAFIAGDGHLVLLHALFDSFTILPVTATLLSGTGWQTLAGGGTLLFALAVYVGSALEARHLAEGGSLFLPTRQVLWAGVIVMMGSLALLTLSVLTATKR